MGEIMATINLTQKLRDEYIELYNTAIVKNISYVESVTDKIVSFKERYDEVQSITNVPWWFTGIIHRLEGNSNFNTHLHNGDSLKARTVQVPAGRPKSGNPPFTWVESAVDALNMKKLGQYDFTDKAMALYRIEAFNGFGYRLYHSHVKSPYLWAYTNHYKSGKYVADGKWSDTAVSKQIGAVAIIKTLEKRGLISFSDSSNIVIEKTDFINPEPIIIMSNKKIEHTDKLQLFLNQLGFDLKIDGKPGKNTNAAFKTVFGLDLKKS